MSNRTKLILLCVLAIVLVGVLVRSFLMLKSVSPPKPAEKKELGKVPTPTTPPPSEVSPPTPQPISGLSLALPPRNPFLPLVSETTPTPPTPPPQPSPPHLPTPVISQVPPGQAPLPTLNLVLMGTVIGPKRIAIIKVGEKNIIIKQGENIDGLTLKRVERGRVMLESLGGEITLKGGEPE